MINTHVSLSYTSIKSMTNGSQRTLFQESQNLYNQLVKIIDYSSYISYSGSVLEHILHTASLTHNEKLFYLIADSLSLINGRNTTKQRSVALSSIKWAEKLGCSKTEIFSLQKSLEEKGYFLIIRDTNEFGKSKRNVIIPTLPDPVFEQLYTAPDRFDINPKDKKLVPSPTYFSTLTSIAKSLDSSKSPNIQTKKRTYLDNTKLFIKLNYQILNLITSSKQLSPFAKILWLYFYSRCYKNHMKSKQFNDDNHANDYFAFTASYQELETQFTCSKVLLSKTIKSLEEGGYINRSRFYVKNDNDNDNLHDKSLWTIIASLPTEHYQQIVELKSRSNKAHEEDISICDPYISYSDHLLNKDFISNNNDIKNLDNIDANPNFLQDPKNLKKDSLSLSELSVSYKNSLEKEKKDQYQKSYQTVIPNVDSPNNPGSEKSKIENDEVIVEQSTYPVEIKNPLIANTNPTISPIKNIKLSKDIAHKAEIKIDKAICKKIVKFSPNSQLKDWYPLLSEDIDMLNSKSGREFSRNFVNELLLKLHSKYPNRIFPTKNHMFSYMTTALKRELHQAPLVNHETFRFSRNDDDSMQEKKREKYLSEVEYSTDTNYEAQLRRKIAAALDPKLAYQLLTTVKFTTTLQEQRVGNNQLYEEFNDQYLDSESTDIVQAAGCLSVDALGNQQADIMQYSQAHSFIVKLNQDIQLSSLQKQILENAITAVYGHVDITYQQLQVNYKKSDKLQSRQQYEIYLEELDPDSTWYKIRTQLKDQFGSNVDKAWFSKLIAEENLESKTLTLFSPTNFIRDWIKNKYKPVIEQFASKLDYHVIECFLEKAQSVA